jgi:hypothetical protein
VADVDGNQLLVSRTHHVLRRISEYVIASLLYDNTVGYDLLLFTTVNFILSSNTKLIFAEQIFTILEQKFDD